ncbi:MAG TPA: class I SAM-dependent methyltransferase [Nocardioides sp.]|jgi:hypothetical protein
MQLAEIEALFRQHWRPGWGSIAAGEVLYVQGLIEEHRPRRFLEVGMASGMSGGLISRILDEYGGEAFTTLDHDNTFFGDPTKENGFLLEDIYPGGRVEVTKRPFTTTLDLDDLGESFDMAFIDANHQHPWPLLDTLLVFPHLTGPRILLHHDLKLFKDQQVPIGIGPKYVYDQLPDSLVDRASTNRGNLFSVRMDLTADELAERAIEGLHLPWTLRFPLKPRQLRPIRNSLRRHYGDALVEAFNVCVERFNPAPAAGRPAPDTPVTPGTSSAPSH